MSVRIVIIGRGTPHAEQRYNTVGDWQFDSRGNLTVTVSSELSEKEQYLVAIHELIEAVCCKYDGVDQDDVDAWDFKGGDGSDPAAPYHIQHVFAEALEFKIAAYIEMNWTMYEKDIEVLMKEREGKKKKK